MLILPSKYACLILKFINYSAALRTYDTYKTVGEDIIQFRYQTRKVQRFASCRLFVNTIRCYCPCVVIIYIQIRLKNRTCNGGIVDELWIDRFMKLLTKHRYNIKLNAAVCGKYLRFYIQWCLADQRSRNSTLKT